MVKKVKRGYVVLVKLIPECIKCGSPVTDSLESEVEEQGQLKRGKYINSIWICNDCADTRENVSPNTPKADEAGV